MLNECGRANYMRPHRQCVAKRVFGGLARTADISTAGIPELKGRADRLRETQQVAEKCKDLSSGAEESV
jgi:hypothetical protein